MHNHGKIDLAKALHSSKDGPKGNISGNRKEMYQNATDFDRVSIQVYNGKED